MAEQTKVKANIDELNKLMRVLKKEKKVRIGIIGSKATALHDNESGLTNAKLGAVHEFGADIEHPGGTPYKILANGKSQFVKKSEGEGLPVTGPHTIKIPKRSFLLEPLEAKLTPQIKNLRKYIFKQFFVKKAADEFYNKLATMSLDIVTRAFTEGYPGWQSLTAATKRRKAKLGQSPKTLIGYGQGGLKSSISVKVINKK